LRYGSGINPARCLASAIAANYYGKLWIYWVGPMIGGMHEWLFRQL
jgi:glycerol uptake facilitator-like aquaporin